MRGGAAGQRHVVEAGLINRAIGAVQGEADVLHEGRRGDRVAVRVGVTPADFGDVAAGHDDRGNEQHLLAGSVRIEKIEAPVVATVVDGVNAAGREGRNIDGRRGERSTEAASITIRVGGVVQTRSARTGERDRLRRIRIAASFIVQRVMLQRLREDDRAVGAVEDSSREVKHEADVAWRAGDLGSGGGQRHDGFLQVTGDAGGSRVAVRIVSGEVDDEELEFVSLAWTQRARVDEEAGVRAVQGVLPAGRRGGDHMFILAIDELDAEIIIRRRAGDGVPGQGKIRRGINRLRRSEVAELGRARIAIAGDGQHIGLRAVVNSFRHERVIAVRERGVERALRHEEFLEVKVIFKSAVEQNGRAAWRRERCVGQRLRTIRLGEAHEDIVGTAIGNGRPRVRLHPMLAFERAEEPDVRPIRLTAAPSAPAIRQDDDGESPFEELNSRVGDPDGEVKDSDGAGLAGDGAGIGTKIQARRQRSVLNGPQIGRLTAVDLNRGTVGSADGAGRQFLGNDFKVRRAGFAMEGGDEGVLRSVPEHHGHAGDGFPRNPEIEMMRGDGARHRLAAVV